MSGALTEIARQDSRTLSFGLSKACLLGESLLNDPGRLRDAVSVMEKNTELSGKLLVAAVRGKAGEILGKKHKDETSAGCFIADWYKREMGKDGSTLMLKLEDLAIALREGKGVLIPVISYDKEDKTFILDGAAVVKGRAPEYAAKAETNGLAWVKGLGRGRLLDLTGKEAGAALKVSGQTVRVSFTEEDELVCGITVKVRGSAEEYPGGTDQTELEGMFATFIEDEIAATHEFLKKHGVDGYGLEERLSKRKPGTYRANNGMPQKYRLNVSAEVRIDNFQ